MEEEGGSLAYRVARGEENFSPVSRQRSLKRFLRCSRSWGDFSGLRCDRKTYLATPSDLSTFTSCFLRPVRGFPRTSGSNETFRIIMRNETISQGIRLLGSPILAGNRLKSCGVKRPALELSSNLPHRCEIRFVSMEFGGRTMASRHFLGMPCPFIPPRS